MSSSSSSSNMDIDSESSTSSNHKLPIKRKYTKDDGPERVKRKYVKRNQLTTQTSQPIVNSNVNNGTTISFNIDNGVLNMLKDRVLNTIEHVVSTCKTVDEIKTLIKQSFTNKLIGQIKNHINQSDCWSHLSTDLLGQCISYLPSSWKYIFYCKRINRQWRMNTQQERFWASIQIDIYDVYYSRPKGCNKDKYALSIVQPIVQRMKSCRYKHYAPNHDLGELLRHTPHLNRLYIYSLHADLHSMTYGHEPIYMKTHTQLREVIFRMPVFQKAYTEINYLSCMNKIIENSSGLWTSFHINPLELGMINAFMFIDLETERIIDNLITNTPLLIKLSLVNCQVTFEMIHLLASKFHLEYLDISCDFPFLEPLKIEEELCQMTSLKQLGIRHTNLDQKSIQSKHPNKNISFISKQRKERTVLKNKNKNKNKNKIKNNKSILTN